MDITNELKMNDRKPAVISLSADQVSSAENKGRESHIVPDSSQLKNIRRWISEAIKTFLKVRYIDSYIGRN